MTSVNEIIDSFVQWIKSRFELTDYSYRQVDGD
jgi:hypothetical protein